MESPTIRLLLIEDSPVDARLIAGLLKQSPETEFESQLATTLSEAFKALAQNSFEVVLLDLVLPDSQGLETYSRLSSYATDLPVIILTGVEGEDVGLAAVQRGAQDFLKKTDLNQAVLVKSIRYAVERHALHQQRKVLQQEVLEAGHRERQRISGDLHDSLGQQLAGLNMLVASLVADCDQNRPVQKETVMAIQSGISEVMTDLKNVIHGLTPVQHDPSGFQIALQRLCLDTQKSTGIKCSLNSDERIRLPDVSAATHLYRIAQESIGNAVKYSGASEIQVRMRRSNLTDPFFSLEIRDDGRGFELDRAATGFGLPLMAYRAELIGAKFDIQSTPDNGTIVSCRLPANFIPSTHQTV